jgi:hypothetical protein
MSKAQEQDKKTILQKMSDKITLIKDEFKKDKPEERIKIIAEYMKVLISDLEKDMEKPLQIFQNLEKCKSYLCGEAERREQAKPCE